jgi:hypothetical protein
MNKDLDLAVLTQLRLHRERTAVPFIDSIPLSMSFISTCWSCTWSAVIFGEIGGQVRTNRNGILVGFAPQQQDHFADDDVHIVYLSIGYFVRRFKAHAVKSKDARCRRQPKLRGCYTD